MPYVQDYNAPYDQEKPVSYERHEAGELLSDTATSTIIYMKSRLVNELDLYYAVHRGDPVGMTREGSLIHAVYNPTDGNRYLESGKVSFVGVALADAKYVQNNNGAYESQSIPILISGDVVASIPINNKQGGYYATGEMVSVSGLGSVTDMNVYKVGLVMDIGQVLAWTPINGDQYVHKRREAYHDILEDIYVDYVLVPVRLTPSGSGRTIEPTDSGTTVINAINTTTDNIRVNDTIALVYNYNNAHWEIQDAAVGAYANAIALENLPPTMIGRVAVRGSVVYTRNNIVHRIQQSETARSTPFGIQFLAAARKAALAGSNANPAPEMDRYYEGMRVTDDLIPITTGQAGNQFGVITRVDKNAGEIEVQMDPVSTLSPAMSIGFEPSNRINEDTPVGTALIENPITHQLEPCRYYTDNVDGYLQPGIELPDENTTDIAVYQGIYGRNVLKTPNGFWSTIKSWGAGVYRCAIKPAAKWAWSNLGPIVMSSLINPLGQVIKSSVATACGRTLNKISGKLPSDNGTPNMITLMSGRRVQSDEIVQDYIDTSASYHDLHPNATYVYPIDAPTSNVSWPIGTCFAVDNGGTARKITDYETPISGISNFDPAQDPVSNGWRIAGISKGHFEFRSSGLRVGDRVLHDLSSGEGRLSQGLRTAVLGQVREVWQPIGQNANDDPDPLCLVEVDPKVIPATGGPSEEIVSEFQFVAGV